MCKKTSPHQVKVGTQNMSHLPGAQFPMIQKVYFLFLPDTRGFKLLQITPIVYADTCGHVRKQYDFCTSTADRCKMALINYKLMRVVFCFLYFLLRGRKYWSNWFFKSNISKKASEKTDDEAIVIAKKPRKSLFLTFILVVFATNFHIKPCL